MRKLIFILLAMTSVLFCRAQADAKSVLDKASAAFAKNNGVKADFKLQISSQGRTNGQTSGTIRIKGNKFVMEAPEGTTWFNGTTQWSYLTATEEVNISNPSEEELQSINPYLLLSTYKKGFTYQLGSTQTYQGKQVYEVLLMPVNKKSDIASITLYIQKSTYQPLYIELRQTNNSLSKITVTGYSVKQDFPDKLFSFDKKEYPDAEEIDLR